MKTLHDLKAQLLADPDTQIAYDTLADGFSMARELIADHRSFAPRTATPVSRALAECSVRIPDEHQ